MLNDSIKANLLQRYPVLAGLPSATLDDTLSGAMAMDVPEGMALFDEGQGCQGFPLLLSGGVRVVKASPGGRELRLYRVAPGESCILTSSCLMGQTAYHARGIAESDTTLVLLPAAAFRHLVASNEAFRNYVFSLFSERMTDLMQLVTAVAFQKLDQRLAALLVSRPSPIHTTHQALADELGSVREMVSRLLKQFEEQGWIRLGRELIELQDPAALKKLANLESR